MALWEIKMGQRLLVAIIIIMVAILEMVDVITKLINNKILHK